MLGNGLKGSLGPVGLPLQLVDCPGSFGSLELVLTIFLGLGASCGKHHLSVANSYCVFGVVLLAWGGGSAREMLSRSTQCD